MHDAKGKGIIDVRFIDVRLPSPLAPDLVAVGARQTQGL